MTDKLKKRIADMSFKMSLGWHYRFKMQALKEGISMTELLRRCFDLYMQSKVE